MTHWMHGCSRVSTILSVACLSCFPDLRKKHKETHGDKHLFYHFVSDSGSITMATEKGTVMQVSRADTQTGR